jgi:hypothetical protein
MTLSSMRRFVAVVTNDLDEVICETPILAVDLHDAALQAAQIEFTALATKLMVREVE